MFVSDERGPFDASRVLHLLHKHEITTLCAPPTAYRQLVLQKNLKHLSNHPPTALSHCVGAGEPLDGGTISAWRSATGVEIKDGYGQTETILLCGNYGTFPIRPGSMGKPLPGVTLSVLNEDLRECSAGAEGSLALLIGEAGKAPFMGVFDGFLDAQNRLYRETKVSTGGSGQQKTWYLTGDRAMRDSDGYDWFVGRADDVINSSGYRIGESRASSLLWLFYLRSTIMAGPFEVESTLNKHFAVVESAVVSSPDSNRGEIVKAFVVLEGQYQGTQPKKIVRELQDFCKSHAAPYKYPRKIEIVDASFLPKTNSGKIKRAELRKREWRHEPKATAAKL